MVGFTVAFHYYFLVVLVRYIVFYIGRDLEYYMCTFARVVGAARDKNHNSFSARGGKKVAHNRVTVIIGKEWTAFLKKFQN